MRGCEFEFHLRQLLFFEDGLSYVLYVICIACKITSTSFSMCLFPGLRLLGAYTDLNEASSLTYANDVIDIYSNSWGPCDEGCVDGPMRLTELALKTGAERVRREDCFA